MNESRRFVFGKSERVSGLKRIEYLFKHGDSFMSYPLRIVFVQRQQNKNQSQVAILVSVPKKRLKRAVQRNRIKRLVRETYRLNKYMFDREILPNDMGLDIALVYVRESLVDYEEIQKSVIKALKGITEQLKKKTNLQ